MSVIRRARPASLAVGLVLLAASVVAASAPRAAAGNAGPRILWVDRASAGCSDALTREQVSRTTPWCALQTAANDARAGDTVRVLPGRYRGTVRPQTSGTASAPIRFLAAPGTVTIDAAGAAVGLKLVGVSWLSFLGLAVTGAAAQGVYIDRATDISLTQMSVAGNGGQGIQARARALTVSHSAISGNAMAGISELSGSLGNSYLGNTISGNGKDRRPYDGDGIQLNGIGATVSENTITHNGDPGIYEHGIYAGSSSSSYLIESNNLSNNAASDIKAAGSSGTVRYNRLGNARLGLVFSDNAQPVAAYYNLIAGTFEHAVFFTTGTTPAKARLWQNTIIQTGRPTASGDDSAVFINSAALADIRNDLICNTSPTTLGLAISFNDRGHTTLISNTNWFCATNAHGRNLAFNGIRITLHGWRAATGQDTASLSTLPATFTPDFHVDSTNLGAQRGQALPLTRDCLGTPVPARRPDVGAYQRRLTPATT